MVDVVLIQAWSVCMKATSGEMQNVNVALGHLLKFVFCCLAK